MDHNHKKSEQGQAIVYLVLGLVVFFGFVAFAIDGGMVLADRRNAQNAADAAALAGAGAAARLMSLAAPECYKDWVCTDAFKDAARDAAITRGGQNNFTLETNFDHSNGVVVTCDSGGLYLDVTVEISTTTPSNFLQLVFPSALHNKVQSVARANAEQPVWMDAAVIGLNPAGCIGGNGVTLNGSGDTTVIGGGIFSNGCLQGNGAAGEATVEGGDAQGHYLQPGNLTWDPEPTLTSDTIQTSDFYIPPPPLDASGNCIGGENVNSLPATMHAGLWCVQGNLNINKNIKSDVGGVTIYMKNGHIFYNGNATVDLSAPGPDPDPSPAIPGILFYVPNGQAVTVNGTSDDHFSGMIYAPKSDIQLTGNADNIFNGQVIGWNVKVGGSNIMTVNYDDCNAYVRPPSIELYK